MSVIGQGTFETEGLGHALILASSGIVTAIPLLLFNSAARRLPLSMLGLLQYIAPTLQLLIGVLVLHEQMPRRALVGLRARLDRARHPHGRRRPYEPRPAAEPARVEPSARR